MYISTNLDKERKEKKFKTENYKVQIDSFAVIFPFSLLIFLMLSKVIIVDDTVFVLGQKYVFKVIWPESGPKHI